MAAGFWWPHCRMIAVEQSDVVHHGGSSIILHCDSLWQGAQMDAVFWPVADALHTAEWAKNCGSLCSTTTPLLWQRNRQIPCFHQLLWEKTKQTLPEQSRPINFSNVLIWRRPVKFKVFPRDRDSWDQRMQTSHHRSSMVSSSSYKSM